MKCGDSLPRELRCLWVERGYVTVEPVAAGRLGTERKPAGRTTQPLAHLRARTHCRYMCTQAYAHTVRTGTAETDRAPPDRQRARERACAACARSESVCQRLIPDPCARQQRAKWPVGISMYLALRRICICAQRHARLAAGGGGGIGGAPRLLPLTCRQCVHARHAHAHAQKGAAPPLADSASHRQPLRRRHVLCWQPSGTAHIVQVRGRVCACVYVRVQIFMYLVAMAAVCVQGLAHITVVFLQCERSARGTTRGQARQAGARARGKARDLQEPLSEWSVEAFPCPDHEVDTLHLTLRGLIRARRRRRLPRPDGK
jgi:hypothetical protein